MYILKLLENKLLFPISALTLSYFTYSCVQLTLNPSAARALFVIFILTNKF